MAFNFQRLLKILFYEQIQFIRYENYVEIAEYLKFLLILDCENNTFQPIRRPKRAIFYTSY